MKLEKTFVITISRQLGSGGAYIGQRLAKKLDVFYADRDIINQVAKQFSVVEEDVAAKDEKLLTFWESFMQFNTFSSGIYVPPKLLAPSDKELYQAEAETISLIAKERSAVIIGRCGSYILRDHPNHVSLYLHADDAFRQERTRKLYHVSKEEALKMIGLSDKDRAQHWKTFTDEEWEDARNYDICLDTSKLDPDHCVELVLNYLKLAGIVG